MFENGTAMGTVRGQASRHLSVKLVALVALVVIVAASAYVIWTQSRQGEAVESKVLAEARTLNVEMSAVWDYIDDSQDAINFNSDGTYDFKGIYCSMAGKAIAQHFTSASNNYMVRYVRENPRTATDEPDEFERTALNHFVVGGSREYYATTEFEGRPVFRYASVLPIKRNCLQCHGEPVGEPDETGFLREGMELGDVAGAVSIIIPMDSYIHESQMEFSSSVAFFCILALAIVAVLLLSMHRWVAEPLEQANRQLEDENQQKSDFLATMSHELRTPLSSIIAFTDIWEKSHPQDSPEERKLVEEIKQNSSVLLNMVNNTIDAAKLEVGQLKIQCCDVDVVDVVEAVFSVAESLAIKEGIHLIRAVDPETPFLRSDPEALRKIVLNLVGNAIKYTAAGGSVEVRAGKAPDGEGVIVEVRDTGVGIRKENLDAIFDKFNRPGADDGAVISGSGLGLYLVKTLTERLGGAVAVKSEVGRGSAFTVRLPFQCPEEAGGGSAL